MKLSKIINELSKGNSVKFSKNNKPKIQIQKREIYEVIIFNRFGHRNIYKLKKYIYEVSKYIDLDKKGLKELGFSKKEIDDIKTYAYKAKKSEIKIFKRPRRKSLGAEPINNALEERFKENEFSYIPEFRTYRIRIRSIADYISVEGTDIVVYEVKSDVDTFLRLEKQVKDYLTYADKVYIVLHIKKLKSFMRDYSHLLETCGLIIFDKELEFKKEAPRNKAKKKRNLLLSKEELSVLKQFKGYTKIKDKNKFFKNNFDRNEIDEIVSNILSSRFDKRREKDYTEGLLTLDISEKEVII